MIKVQKKSKHVVKYSTHVQVVVENSQLEQSKAPKLKGAAVRLQSIRNTNSYP